MKGDLFDIILLLALPASGKSEVRKYIRHLPPQTRRNDFHIGESVQLDDFPYVHMMRRIDDELAVAGQSRFFFFAPDRSFQDPFIYGTLIHLLNEDYEDLLSKKIQNPVSAGLHLLERIDRAALKADAKPLLKNISVQTQEKIIRNLEKEAREMLVTKQKAYPDTLRGKTLIFEFARGGPDKFPLPLQPPWGYRYALSQLSEGILKRSVILYVWVTPEEARRKNQEREDLNDPGSILHHSVPLEVMMNDYGCDDIDWLESHSEVKGTVTIQTHGKKFLIPIARFDNRKDKTSFIREDENRWQPSQIQAVHEALKDGLGRLR